MLTSEDYRKLAESTEITANSKPISNRKLPLPLIIGGAMTAIASIWLLGGEADVSHRLTEPEREQFHTGSFIPPQLPEEKEQRIESDRVEIQPEPDMPPPPPPPLPPIVAPIMPPPIETITAEDNSAKWERLRSPMIIFSSTVEKSASNADPASANANAADGDANSAFLDSQAKKGVQVSIAGKISRPDATVIQGTMIRGLLTTAINSDLPGDVKAIVEDDVWSLDGQRILITKGAILLGSYRAFVARGQNRVLIAWNRVVQSDGTSVQLGSIGIDQLGRAGVEGTVDRHLLLRYGGATMLTIIGGATQYLAGYNHQGRPSLRSRSHIDAITGETITDYTNPNSLQARELASRTLAQAIQDMAGGEFKESNSIQDTIHINQGTPIAVFVRNDLDFSGLYPDPVWQKYQELRRHAK